MAHYYRTSETFIYILMLIFGLLLFLALVKCHRTELENDGFKIIEKHETYYLVEKDKHWYIATETGWYNMSWTFEHSPQCPCSQKSIKNE